MNVEWNTPESVPDVEKGTEKEFWVAVRSEHAEKDLVLVAHYQNRPLEFDDDGEASGDFLTTPDGEPHHSVGWVLRTEHEDFDGFYTAFQFSEKYCLLGWAEYVPPVFTGVGEQADKPAGCSSDPASCERNEGCGCECEVLKDQQLKVVVEDGVFSVSIGVDVLCHACEVGRSYGLEGIVITDKEVFVQSVARQLEFESEAGTTAVHELFDNAVSQMLEDGEEGIDLVGE